MIIVAVIVLSFLFLSMCVCVYVSFFVVCLLYFFLFIGLYIWVYRWKFLMWFWSFFNELGMFLPVSFTHSISFINVLAVIRFYCISASIFFVKLILSLFTINGLYVCVCVCVCGIVLCASGYLLYFLFSVRFSSKSYAFYALFGWISIVEMAHWQFVMIAGCFDVSWSLCDETFQNKIKSKKNLCLFVVCECIFLLLLFRWQLVSYTSFYFIYRTYKWQCFASL